MAGTLGSMASGEKLLITRLPRGFRYHLHTINASKGSPSDSLVELIDIYPTLCDLANIPQPDHLAGKSLVPVLHNPNAIVKSVAMSRSNPALREWAANPLSPARNFLAHSSVRWSKKSENNKAASGIENPKRIYGLHDPRLLPIH